MYLRYCGFRTYQIPLTEVMPLCWMAPETLRNRDYTFASDVWSFGVFCWVTLLLLFLLPTFLVTLKKMLLLTAAKFLLSSDWCDIPSACCLVPTACKVPSPTIPIGEEQWHWVLCRQEALGMSHQSELSRDLAAG